MKFVQFYGYIDDDIVQPNYVFWILFDCVFANGLMCQWASDSSIHTFFLVHAPYCGPFCSVLSQMDLVIVIHYWWPHSRTHGRLGNSMHYSLCRTYTTQLNIRPNKSNLHDIFEVLMVSFFLWETVYLMYVSHFGLFKYDKNSFLAYPHWRHCVYYFVPVFFFSRVVVHKFHSHISCYEQFGSSFFSLVLVFIFDCRLFTLS